MLHIVKIPRLNPNEDEAVVMDIFVEPGECVEPGDELFVLETAKAAVVVEAEVAACVRKVLVHTGETARVGQDAVLLTDAADESYEHAVPGPDDGVEREQAARTTAKERLLAKRRAKGAAADRRTPPGAAREAASPVPSGELEFVLRALGCLDAVSPADADAPMVRVDEGTRGDGAGCSIHSGAVIGEGAVILGRRIVLEDNAVVGPGAFIEADEVFIGSCAKVGGRTRVVTGRFIAAEGAYVGEDVEVDLGGGRSADSALLVGRASLVSPRCWVNTCREVVLEDESALSPGVFVFTHRFWQSVLEGYSAAFAPVRLCTGSWAGAGCQIMPGVVFGRGSIAVSNSTVAESVPEECMVAGIPATVVRRGIKRELAPDERDEAVRGILREFAPHLEFKGCSCMWEGDTLAVRLPDGTGRRVAFEPDGLDGAPEGVDVLLCFGWRGSRDGVAVFDLEAKRFSGPEDRLVHELRNFLRRRGIRFAPYAWDGGYRHGL